MKTRHCHVICFDITDDKKRRRVVKILEGAGIRVQKSVFECWLTDTQSQNIKSRLEAEIDLTNDSIRTYLLCDNCLKKIEITGKGIFTEHTEVIVI